MAPCLLVTKSSPPSGGLRKMLKCKIQAHDGAIDNGKTLETAGARPMSDRRRLEKTLIAPHPDHSEIAHHCNVNPEPGLQAGLGASCAAALVALLPV